MPNHIENRITLKGDKEKIEELIEKFSTHYPEIISTTHDGLHNYTNENSEYGRWDSKKKEFTIDKDEKNILKEIPENFKPLMEEAWTRFPDFNKIIPMPEGLHIKKDGLISLLENQFAWNEPLKKRLDSIRKGEGFSYDEQIEKQIDNFAKGIKNYLKYGTACWYDWAIKNWGTKWNAYGCEKIDDNIFQFRTAWSGVPYLIHELSYKFPEVEFYYEWSDEDTGSNCGTGKYLNGVIEKHIFENQSKESYDLAFKLHPGSKENYKLVDGEYKYIENE